MKIGVIGAGTWGTALAMVLAHNGHQVMLRTRGQEDADWLRTKRSHKNLPGAVIPANVSITTDLVDTVLENDLLVLAVASPYIRSTAREIAPYVKPGQIVVDVAKGIESGSLMTMTEIIESEIPGVDAAVLSGPSHAEEVARALPTTIVAGAHREHIAKTIQDVFMSPYFRVYISPDLKGIEIGGALKNVIALAAGIADGIGYGDNSKAALITRGIAEITRLGIKMGGKAETFAGLSGIGDLVVTCASMHSRNRRAGILIGQGKTAQEAMQEVGQVVEGVYAAKSGRELAERYQVQMPIVEEVNRILFEGKPVKDAVQDLMLRDRRTEHSGLKFEMP
jgi:glycerol-3-phosphate dehydrogenase (NAD(P)+)